MLHAILTLALGNPKAELSVTFILLEAPEFSDTDDFENDPSHFVGPSPCGQGGSTVFQTTPPENPTASSRINVTDNSALGLPRATVRMACSKGTYVRAFARDLGESLGTGAHLDSLQRSRSGIFRVEDALTVERTIEILATQA